MSAKYVSPPSVSSEIMLKYPLGHICFPPYCLHTCLSSPELSVCLPRPPKVNMTGVNFPASFYIWMESFSFISKTN